jgi:hypothetical protein
MGIPEMQSDRLRDRHAVSPGLAGSGGWMKNGCPFRRFRLEISRNDEAAHRIEVLHVVVLILS